MLLGMEALSESQPRVPHLLSRFDQFSTLQGDLGHKSALVLATRTARYASSEPRDRIFAILPLTSETDEPLFVPDYTLPLDEFSRRTTLAALGPKPDLRKMFVHECVALGLAVGDKSRSAPTKPSWVVDLSVPLLHRTETLYYFEEFGRLLCWHSSHVERKPRQPKIIENPHAGIRDCRHSLDPQQVAFSIVPCHRSSSPSQAEFLG